MKFWFFKETKLPPHLLWNVEEDSLQLDCQESTSMEIAARASGSWDLILLAI